MAGRLLLLGLASCAGLAPDPPLPQCPAFATSVGDDPMAAYGCSCEISDRSGCRGITPRFNWIIASCDVPNGETGHNGQPGGTGNAAFPSPQPRPVGYFQCADPMRLRPADATGSKVELRYIASYQWGEPCESALFHTCAGHLGSPDACISCTASHAALLHTCAAQQLGDACDTCGVALRSSSWTDGLGVLERCGQLGSSDCLACLSGPNQKPLKDAGCRSARLRAFCRRSWGLVGDSSVNTQAEHGPLLDLKALEQPGGAAMWNRGAYMPGVLGLAPPGMLFVISCKVCSGFAWFVLNQGTLDRGPDNSTCTSGNTSDNCWTSASAGELDLLETGFWDPAFYNTSNPYTGKPNPNRNNSRLYLTSSQVIPTMSR